MQLVVEMRGGEVRSLRQQLALANQQVMNIYKMLMLMLANQQVINIYKMLMLMLANQQVFNIYKMLKMTTDEVESCNDRIISA